MIKRRTKKIPPSLSSSQVVMRVIIAGVLIFSLIFVGLLLNHWYLYTHSETPSKLTSVQSPSFPPPEPKPSSTPGGIQNEPEKNTPLTFYDQLTNRKEQSELTEISPSTSEKTSAGVTGSEALSSTTSSLPEEKSVNKKMGYTVQIGSFQNLESAEKVIEWLKQKGFSPSLTKVSLPNGTTWHRVRIENCSSREEAEEVVQKAKEIGKLEPMIISSEKQN